MAKAKRDLLEVLRLELEFLKNGGYRRAPSWRSKLIFEDSPTCLHYSDPEQPRPCSECVMMQFSASSTTCSSVNSSGILARLACA